MALTFPLALETFFNRLSIAPGGQLWLTENAAGFKTAGGEILTYSTGARLWRARIDITPMERAAAAEIAALVHALTEPGRSFLACPPYSRAPAADPTGAILGASSVTLSGVAGNNRDVTLAGLPPGYILTAGDHLSFTHTSGARAFHQIVVGATASGAGEAVVEVTPHVRSGWSAGAAVALRPPVFRAIIEQGSVRPASMGLLLDEGLTLSFTQTLRA